MSKKASLKKLRAYVRIMDCGWHHASVICTSTIHNHTCTFPCNSIFLSKSIKQILWIVICGQPMQNSICCLFMFHLAMHNCMNKLGYLVYNCYRRIFIIFLVALHCDTFVCFFWGFGPQLYSYSILYCTYVYTNMYVYRIMGNILVMLMWGVGSLLNRFYCCTFRKLRSRMPLWIRLLLILTPTLRISPSATGR